MEIQTGMERIKQQKLRIVAAAGHGEQRVIYRLDE